MYVGAKEVILTANALMSCAELPQLIWNLVDVEFSMHQLKHKIEVG